MVDIHWFVYIGVVCVYVEALWVFQMMFKSVTNAIAMVTNAIAMVRN